MPKVPINALTGTIVVLVVEDEALVRTLAVEFFADMGFDAVAAPDANSAIRILQIEAARVHVLFTDVQMPGPMDGLMLAHHVRRNWPWIGLVVTSAYATWGLERLPANTQFFRKPYELAAIDYGVSDL